MIDEKDLHEDVRRTSFLLLQCLEARPWYLGAPFAQPSTIHLFFLTPLSLRFRFVHSPSCRSEKLKKERSLFPLSSNSNQVPFEWYWGRVARKLNKFSCRG